MRYITHMEQAKRVPGGWRTILNECWQAIDNFNWRCSWEYLAGLCAGLLKNEKTYHAFVDAAQGHKRHPRFYYYFCGIVASLGELPQVHIRKLYSQSRVESLAAHVSLTSVELRKLFPGTQMIHRKYSTPETFMFNLRSGYAKNSPLTDK